ncbi:unnamed protein product [Boreogadus saida]
MGNKSMMEVKDNTLWYLGVARESINRKGGTTLTPETGYWILYYYNGAELWLSDDDSNKGREAPLDLSLCPEAPLDLSLCPEAPLDLSLCPEAPLDLSLCPEAPLDLSLCPEAPLDLSLCPEAPLDLSLCPRLPWTSLSA